MFLFNVDVPVDVLVDVNVSVHVDVLPMTVSAEVAAGSNKTLAIAAAIDNLRNITFSPPIRVVPFCSFVTERSVNGRSIADRSKDIPCA